MQYMPTPAFQAICFVYSAGLGFTLGIIYDFFRILFYLLTGNDKKLSVCRDIIYSLVCLGAAFLFLLVVCNGQLRMYLFIGGAIGLTVYVYSLSNSVFPPVKIKIDKIRLLISQIKTAFHLLFEKICKNLNKRLKISKKYLHIEYNLLYNSCVRLFSRNKTIKNRGDESG